MLVATKKNKNLSGLNKKYNQYKIKAPTEYEGVITHFYIAENNTQETVVEKLLPSYQTILVFVFGNHLIFSAEKKLEVIIEKCVVLGPIKKAISYSLLPRSAIFVVNFKDDAFYRFFGTAIIENSLPIHPDELLTENCFSILRNNLLKLKSYQEKIDFILAFCKPYLRPQDEIAKQLANFENFNLNPIKYVADSNNQTERNIQIKHKKYFGYSAKELSRYHRFLKAIQLINKKTSISKSVNWFEIIGECSYYDQSQFIHDFKYFINMTPSKYLSLQNSICNSTL